MHLTLLVIGQSLLSKQNTAERDDEIWLKAREKR